MCGVFLFFLAACKQFSLTLLLGGFLNRSALSAEIEFILPTILCLGILRPQMSLFD